MTTETRAIPIADIDIPDYFRKTSPKVVTQLAESIQVDGLLQPIGVRLTSEGRYELVYGGHRLAAFVKIKRPAIEATVLDVTAEAAMLAHLAENLFRSKLKGPEYIEALAAWNRRYLADHADVTHGDRVSAGMAASKEDRDNLSQSLTTPSKEPEEQPKATESFSAQAAPQMGVSRRTIQRDLAVGRKLDAETTAILKERGVDLATTRNLAALSETQRQHAVALIASGMDPKMAIATATAPESATIEVVDNPDLPGHKAEPDMTDAEWLDFYCADILGRLKYQHVFRGDAVLWRQTRAARAEFKSKTKKAMGRSKTGDNGPFRFAMNRVVVVVHPNDWMVCGPCGGTGMDGNISKCSKCFGNGYVLKTEAA